MIKQYLQELLDTRAYHPATRRVEAPYLLDREVADRLCRDGYAVIKGIVPEAALQLLDDTYAGLREQPGFYEAGSFMPTPQYGKTIQRYIHDRLKGVNELLLPRLCDPGQCRSDFFNLLVLKYPHEDKSLFAHQDISFIDESETAGSFLWIPAETIDERNGALWVLPKSHLWAAWQRTHDQHDAPYDAHRELLLNYMVPVYLERGDLIILDSAIIHASAANRSGKVRVAMNTSLLPRGPEMVHYCAPPGTPKGMIRRYSIDEAYCEELHYTEPDTPPARYGNGRLERLRYDGRLSKRNLIELLETYR